MSIVGYRTDRDSILCLDCAKEAWADELAAGNLTPIYFPEAEALCNDGSDECAECEACLLEVYQEKERTR